jgi:hypothetical protein
VPIDADLGVGTVKLIWSPVSLGVKVLLGVPALAGDALHGVATWDFGVLRRSPSFAGALLLRDGVGPEIMGVVAERPG